MDKHLGYVALSRHRDRTDLYVSDDLMRGQRLGNVVSRVRRQETALELAERHGLELDTASIDPLNFTAMQTDSHQQEPSPEGTTMAEAALISLAADKAGGLLDAEKDRVLNELHREHAKERAGLAAISEASRLALETPEKSHPGRSLFGGKAREAAWNETRKTLEVEHHNDERAVKRVEQEYNDTSEYREYAAGKRAAEHLPEAAAVVSSAKAQEQATQLVGRWQSLEATINRLGVDSDSREAQNARTQLRQALQQISRASEAVRRAMGAQERARARNEKSIERAQGRDRGLGR